VIAAQASRPVGLRFCVLGISVATVLSGALQLVFPNFVLGFVAGPGGPVATQFFGPTPMAAHFFAIIGMFMLLFGMLLLHALLSPGSPRVVLLWCALQKLGASAAVGIGVGRGIFSTLALAIAAFDFISGLLFFWYRAQSLE
jgi:hypothetical protein